MHKIKDYILNNKIKIKRYILLGGFTYLLGILWIYLLVDRFGMKAWLAQSLSIFPFLLIKFVASDLWVFKK